MEIVQHYLNQYHDHMRSLNVLNPSIEPLASGHVIEQQEMVRTLAVGDDIVTIGGMHARVVALSDNTMDVTVDADGENVLRFERSSLGRIVQDEPESE